MSRYKSIEGYCPEQQNYETIDIRYSQIPRMGAEPGYKKTTFYCDYGDDHDCSFANRNECPLYNDAPVTL